MTQSTDKLIQLCKGKPFCVFTDLDYTCCIADHEPYENENKKDLGVERCFMNPDIRRSLLHLHQQNCPVFFVTGRHWSDRRLDDKTNQYVPDGALNDLLGGEKSPLADFDAIAGHGRQIIRDKKVTVLKRSSNTERQKTELKFERYAGERMLKIRKMVMEKFPDAAAYVHAEYKKHISYVNIVDYPVTDKARFETIFNFIKTQVEYILSGKDENGCWSKDVPENINKTFVSSIDKKGSVDIRSMSQNKGRALLHSGFMEQAYQCGTPVLVMGDSLAAYGTDRDMFLCIKDFFQKQNAEERVFLLHILNNEEANHIWDRSDPCYPDITLNSDAELGKLMLFITH